ncbi:YkvA family protein [Hippea jasoniae]|uniref:YkvA family protein n=1 Tax=Hippea jasoniae TaxID=944479 RepID=UPI0009FFAF1B|nr:DUF1232 domain-containing protein [Hippea jasoniae]
MAIKNTLAKVGDYFTRFKEFDLEGFVDEAKAKIEKIKEDPVGFTLTTVLQLKLAVEMVDCYIKKQCKFPYKTLLSLVGVLLYFINPLDIIPDFLPGIGYLDDAVVVGLALKFIRDDLREFAISRGYNPADYGLD